MAIEDLHWIDKSSEDALKYFLESIPGARVLLIFTYRPEFVHTWGGRSYHNQINLNRLSNRESLFMAAHLLGTQEIDKDLEKLILEKTEGVPFFIEELLKSLKDLKIIEGKDSKYQLAKDIQSVAIPSTIQDMIMARVDALPDTTKTVLQTGSVIEREFSYELIKEVMGLPETELLSHLSILKDSELLYERGIFPQSTYIFKHSLTREVVYGSIMARKKKRLHEQIGKAIEKLYPDKMEEHYGVLGEHFIASENLEKGAEYLKLAARKARNAGSYKEAIEHAKKRVLCFECLPVNPENQKKVIDARVALGDYFMILNRHVEARDAVAPIFDLTVQLNDQRRLPGIYRAFGTYYLWVEEDYSKGLEYLSKAATTSEKTGSLWYLWQSCFYLGVSLSWNCEFEKSTECFRRSLDLSEKAGNLGGIAFVKGTMSTYNLTFRGKNDLGYTLSKESLQAANESGDTYNKGMAYSSYGSCCYFKGLFSEAENALLQGRSICEKTGHNSWRFWVTYLLGLLYSDRGEYGKSLKYHQEALSISELDRSFPSFANLQKLCLERVEVLNNNRNIQLSEFTSKYCEKNKLKIFEGTLARYIGEIFLKIDDQHMSEAEDWIKKALEVDKKNGTIWSFGADHALYAELFKRKGDRLKAQENMGKAIKILKECGADGWVEKYEKEMAAIS
jgi:tetratricopeptide (TPR) repeat protein